MSIIRKLRYQVSCTAKRALLFVLITCSISSFAQRFEYSYIGSFDQDSMFFNKLPHFQSLTAKFVAYDKEVYLFGLDKKRNLISQKVDTASHYSALVVEHRSAIDTSQAKIETLRNIYKYNNKLHLYTLNNVYSIEKGEHTRFRIEQINNINNRLGATAKHLYQYNNNYYLLATRKAFECSQNKMQSERMTDVMFLLRLSTDSFSELWEMPYVFEFSKNLGFQNFYFKNNRFIYFDPLTYTCDEVNLKTGKTSTYDFTEKTSFQKSDFMQLLLKDGYAETRYVSYDELKSSKEIKDRIITTYDTDSGYLVWRTSYPDKEHHQLDLVSHDLKRIVTLKHSFVKPTPGDSVLVSNFDNFPVYPINNWISFVGEYMIVAVPYQKQQPNIGMTVGEIYHEWEQNLLMPHKNKGISYLIYRYSIDND